jgi:3-isopropylmalate/(R)-2-methylmalate dehydratase small subunit
MQKITHIDGRGVPLRGNDIDTDRIIPARFLVTVTFEGLEHHVFEDDRKAADHPFDDPRYKGASVLIVNSNFGCGSSREHAPQALQRWGIRGIIGESFAEIFFGNSAMIGMPCVTAPPAEVQAIQERLEKNPEARVHIDLLAGTCEVDGLRSAVTLPSRMREAFTSGAWDTTGMLLDNFEQVEATAARLPYVSDFSYDTPRHRGTEA